MQRTGPRSVEKFSADGYIAEFKRLCSMPAVKNNGFEAKILELKEMIYKEMAFIAIYTRLIYPVQPCHPNKVSISGY